MTPFRVLWDFPARFVLYQLTPAAAAAVDAAILRFAATGDGEIEWDPPYHRLFVGALHVMLAIDLQAQTICVLHIYRAR